MRGAVVTQNLSFYKYPFRTIFNTWSPDLKVCSELSWPLVPKNLSVKMIE